MKQGMRNGNNSLEVYMRIIDVIATILLIIGGLNWGLSLFGVNLVSALFGEGTDLARLTYGLVGLSAIWKIFAWKNCSSRCDSK